MAKYDHDDLMDKSRDYDTYNDRPGGVTLIRPGESLEQQIARQYRDQTTVLPSKDIRTFGTGATRDTDANKIDFEGFLSPLVMQRYGEYMHLKRRMPDGSMRDSDNWQLGIPLNAYIKSAFRHFFTIWQKHRGVELPGQGDDLETELCALLFNVSGYLHETLKAKRGL